MASSCRFRVPLGGFGSKRLRTRLSHAEVFSVRVPPGGSHDGTGYEPLEASAATRATIRCEQPRDHLAGGRTLPGAARRPPQALFLSGRVSGAAHPITTGTVNRGKDARRPEPAVPGPRHDRFP